jgi:COP9 signalosome complex subunit 4
MTAEPLNEITSWMVKDEVPVAVSRDVMTWLVGEIKTKLVTEDGKHDELLKEVGAHICRSVSARTSMGLDEADYTIREMLALVYEDEEDWSEAARVLQPMNVESGHRVFTDTEKAQHYVRIAELYLQVRRRYHHRRRCPQCLHHRHHRRCWPRR